MRMSFRPESTCSQEAQPDKILRLRNRDLIVADKTMAHMPARCFGIVRRSWADTPTIAKVDATSVVVLGWAAEWSATTLGTFFTFGLSLLVRLLFFLLYSLRIEVGEFESRVAARSLMYVNTMTLVAVTVLLIQSDAMWRWQGYCYLVFALVMEVIGIRTWYTKWAAVSELWNNGNDGLSRVFNPRKWYLLAAFAFLLTEYIAFGIVWNQLIDDVLLFVVRIPWWIYHIINLIYHAFHH